MLKILDCSIRDGGYYNNWNFDPILVNRYLKCMEEVGVNAVEIGFRSPPEKDIGLFGNVTDSFIDTILYKPKIEYFGIMINAKEMNSSLIKCLFSNQNESPINLVRVVVLFKDAHTIENILVELKRLGYYVCCNLMQSADKSYDEIKTTCEIIQSWGCVDVLYLADSFGGMSCDSVNYAYMAVKESWKGLTGFHGHNNKGQGLSNSLEAIDFGVDWIDGTVLGMGRGAGNTEIEYLLNELNKRNFEFNLEPLYTFAMGDFYKLKNQYNWGLSLAYYLGAEYNIHPTYIQTLVQTCPNDIILKSINYLKGKQCSSFNKELLKESLK